jgi:hypothetical protein
MPQHGIKSFCRDQKRIAVFALATLLILTTFNGNFNYGASSTDRVTLDGAGYNVADKHEEIQTAVVTPGNREQVFDGSKPVWGGKSVTYDETNDNGGFDVTLAALGKQVGNKVNATSWDIKGTVHLCPVCIYET